MAYVSPEMKQKLAPGIKQICKKYGVKATLSVRNHSTLVLTIASGSIDFIGNYNEVGLARNNQLPHGFTPLKNSLEVNTYWYHEHFSGKALDCLGELVKALKGPDYFDKSDIMTDYFHCSHYIAIHVGRWNKAYEVTA